MAGVVGQARSYYKKFKFIVEIDGVAFAGFQKCSALEAEIAVVEQSEGGTLIPDKSPGRVKFSDLTLDRGATQDVDLFTWFKQVVDASANSGLKDSQYKRNLDVVQQDRDGTSLRRWRVTRAWPTKFSAGEWDNDADENVMESITLAFDYFDIAS